jgi:hypothetical protein
MSNTYMLSKRKSIADEMGYQAGKLYEVCDAQNKIRTKWFCWTQYSKGIFDAAIGSITIGDLVVFLGFENNFLKLLLPSGLVVYVAYVSDLILKPAKTP